MTYWGQVEVWRCDEDVGLNVLTYQYDIFGTNGGVMRMGGDLCPNIYVWHIGDK